MLRIFSLLILICSIPLSFLFADAGISNCTFQANPNGLSQFMKACANGTYGISPDGPSDIQGIKDRIASVAKRVIQLGALLAVGALVFSGIQYTTAYGDDEKLKHAKSTGIYAAIGLLLLMGAFGLVDILVRFIYDIVATT